MRLHNWQKGGENLSADDFLDGVSRYRVEEEDDHEDDRHHDEELEDFPLVVVPHDVPNGLEGVQEPHEGRVGTAGTKEIEKMAWGYILRLETSFPWTGYNNCDTWTK